MDSRDVLPEHAARIRHALRPKLQYLGRLKARMEDLGFVPSDPLFILVKNAHDSLHALCVELHYMSCKGGVGRKPPGKQS